MKHTVQVAENRNDKTKFIIFVSMPCVWLNDWVDRNNSMQRFMEITYPYNNDDMAFQKSQIYMDLNFTIKKTADVKAADSQQHNWVDCMKYICFQVIIFFFHFEYWWKLTRSYGNGRVKRGDSRLAPSQWETSLQSNAFSHWLGTNLESFLVNPSPITLSPCIPRASPALILTIKDT